MAQMIEAQGEQGEQDEQRAIKPAGLDNAFALPVGNSSGGPTSPGDAAITEQGAAPLPLVIPNGETNEQTNLGGARLPGGSRNDGNTWPANRPGDADGLAEVVEEVENEIIETDSRPFVDGDPANSGNQHLVGTVRDDDRLDLDSGKDALGQAASKGQARLRDRQPVSAFDSAQKPVQATLTALPVSEPPVENKEVIPACTVQPVQAKAACPALIAWRQADGGIWLPRYFTAVPHLKYEFRILSADFQPVVEFRTGWQIQWNTACPKCGKRFRPVAGFVTILHLERMKELPEDEQQNFIADIIGKKFTTGTVSSGHSKCLA